jgi:hypothetical protein
LLWQNPKYSIPVENHYRAKKKAKDEQTQNNTNTADKKMLTKEKE